MAFPTFYGSSIANEADFKFLSLDLSLFAVFELLLPMGAWEAWVDGRTHVPLSGEYNADMSYDGRGSYADMNDDGGGAGDSRARSFYACLALTRSPPAVMDLLLLRETNCLASERATSSWG